MAAFIKALLFVVVAEMGDKTQLLAIAFAGKFKVKDVMIGVFIATVLNHGLAVAFGSYLNMYIPFYIIQFAAAISFIVFGLWTLRGDKIDDEDKKQYKFGPIATVAIAFFIAELGDKTQLMTIAIAAQYKAPIFILMGTTIGMMVADGIGILGGAWLAKHVPENYIKWGSAMIFLVFGLVTLYNVLPTAYQSPLCIMLLLLVLSVLVYLFGIRTDKHKGNDMIDDIDH